MADRRMAFDYQTFRRGFLAQYCDAIMRALRALPVPLPPDYPCSTCLADNTTIELELREPSPLVQARFMSAIMQYPVKTLKCKFCWHGTLSSFIEPIFAEGFKKPDEESQARNGSAYGIGIYGAVADALWLAAERRFTSDEIWGGHLRDVDIILAAALCPNLKEHRHAVVCFNDVEIVPVGLARFKLDRSMSDIKLRNFMSALPTTDRYDVTVVSVLMQGDILAVDGDLVDPSEFFEHDDRVAICPHPSQGATVSVLVIED